MKWLKRIVGKGEIPSTVAFDEIDAWLETVAKSLFRGLSANADKLYSEISAIRERLKQKASTLQDADPKEDIPDTIMKIGLPNRDKVVKDIHSLTERISIPTQTDYKTVLSFYDATTSSTKFTLDKSAKTLYYVRSLFPDEVKEIDSDLKRLRVCLNLLIRPMKGKESKIKDLERVQEMVRGIKDILSEMEKEKEQINDNEKERSALESDVEAEENELRSIEEGEEWVRYKELEAELASRKRELNALESEISRLFSPIMKELKLLKKQDDSGRYTFTPEERRAVSSILSSPVQALGEDINAFLIAIENLVEADSSILKARKRDKTLNWIDHLLSAAELSTIKVKHEQLQSRIVKTSSKLSDMTIRKEIKEHEQSLGSRRRQLTRLQEGTARSNRHLISLEEELTNKNRLLLESVKMLAGKEIEVKFVFDDIAIGGDCASASSS